MCDKIGVLNASNPYNIGIGTRTTKGSDYFFHTHHITLNNASDYINYLIQQPTTTKGILQSILEIKKRIPASVTNVGRVGFILIPTSGLLRNGVYNTRSKLY